VENIFDFEGMISEEAFYVSSIRNGLSTCQTFDVHAPNGRICYQAEKFQLENDWARLQFIEVFSL
jgi:hypothetical protein